MLWSAPMAEPTRIQRLTAAPLDVALLQPFGIAGGTSERVEAALVTVELSDGTLGFGEAAPLPAFNGETRAATLEAVLEARRAVEGEDARAWRRISARLPARAGGAARCAIETAVLDALAKRAGMPLWVF